MKESCTLVKLNPDSQFRIVILKNYEEKAAKEKPLNNIVKLFKESCLIQEKQVFHKNILNSIIKKCSSFQLERLQQFYIEHLRTVAELETYSCSLCDYETIQKESLQSHLFLIHKQEMDVTWFHCLSCDYRCEEEENLNKHFVTNHQNKAKTTLHNKKLTKTINEIAKAYSMTKDRKPKKITEQECDLCEFKSLTIEIFQRHKSIHIDPDHPKRFLCHLCDYGNTNRTELAKHLLNFHQLLTKRASQIKSLKCEYCEYKCSSTQYLKRHLISHKDPSETLMHKCTACKFQTKHRASFSIHMKNHQFTDEQLRKFMCEICSKRFKQKAKLAEHLLTHKTMEEVGQIFPCPQCPFKAKCKRSFDMHQAVHKEPEFVCDVCGHRSKRKDAHNRHKLIHKGNGDKVFKCSFCNYENYIIYNLRKHLKKKHFNQTEELTF